MKHPLISVIVPIYNIEKYVGLCIESIINQTYSNLEIILVDDGSPDRCPEICDLYSKKDDRIKVIHRQNGGLVSARKAGLSISNGTYIGYVDGDDWIGPEFYESLYKEMVKSKADLVAAGYSRDLFDKNECFLNALPLGIYEGNKLRELQSNMISYGEFYRPGIATYVWNKLFKRDILIKHQMNVDDRISIGEDAAVTYPVIMDCKSISITNNCEYHYRQREDSMLKKSLSFNEESVKLRILHEYMTTFASNHLGHKLQKQIDDYILSICIIRSGGVCSKSNADYQPYNRDLKDKDVVVYSAGTYGQQIVNRLKEYKHFNVVGWIDDDYCEYRRCCLDVDEVESVTKLKYDYILIASVDSMATEKIQERLTKLGVNTDKILTVKCPVEKRKELIQKYLY